MKPEKLRSYIRKEIQLQEAAGDIDSSEIKDVFDSFKNVFVVAGIALKSIVSSLVLNVGVFFELDSSNLESYFDAYTTRLSSITREYESALNSANENISKFMPLLFLTNPGAYAAYKIADSYSSNFDEAREFLAEIGLASTSQAWSSAGLAKSSQKLLDLFAGKSGKRNESTSISKLVNRQKSISSKINDLFGFNVSENASLNNNLIVENSNLNGKDKNLAGMLEDILFKSMPKVGPEAFGISPSSSKSILEMKKKEAEDFEKMIAAPVLFLNLLKDAKTLEDVKSALSLLKSAPFVIKNVEKITPEFLESSAKKAIEAAKKKNKTKELLDSLGLKEEPNEEQFLNVVKAYQLKNLLGQMIVKSSESLIKQTEDLREFLLKRYQENIDIELVSKIASGSEFETIMKKGVEKIKNAGKQASKAV